MTCAAARPRRSKRGDSLDFKALLRQRRISTRRPPTRKNGFAYLSVSGPFG
jgi:hypothetical protein